MVIVRYRSEVRVDLSLMGADRVLERRVGWSKRCLVALGVKSQGYRSGVPRKEGDPRKTVCTGDEDAHTKRKRMVPGVSRER